MPVDNRVADSIVDAYARGRQDALNRLALQQEKEKEAERIKLQKEEQQQRKDEFTQKLDLDTKQFQAQQEQAALLQEAQKIEIQNHIHGLIDKGVIPEPYKQTAPQLDPQVSGILESLGLPSAQQYGLIENQGPPSKLLPQKMMYETPEYQKEKAFKLTQAGKDEDQQRAIQLEQTKSQFRSKEDELKNNLPVGKIKQAELDNALKVARINHEHDLEIARLRASISNDKVSPMAELLLSNPDLFYDDKVGTPKQKMDAAAELKHAYGYNILDHQKNAVNELAPRTLDILKDIRDDKEFQWGFSSVAKIIPGTKAYGDSQTIESLIAALTVPEMKAIRGLGSMSDADREFISNIPSKLALGLDPAVGKREIDRLIGIYEKINKGIGPKVTPAPATPDPLANKEKKPLSGFISIETVKSSGAK